MCLWSEEPGSMILPFYNERNKKNVQDKNHYWGRISPISSTFSHHKTFEDQDPVRVSSAQDFSLHCGLKLGFVFAQRCFDLKCLRWLSCFMLDSQVYPYQVLSLDSKFCPVNWTVDLEINCIGEKVNCGQLTVKSHENWPTSTYLFFYSSTFVSFFLKMWKKVSYK